MIQSFRHKGLRIFHTTGETRGIRPEHARRLARVLSFLDNAYAPADVDLPGWRLHALKGLLSGFWSITVSGNWRVIFRFVEGGVELVDYLDDH